MATVVVVATVVIVVAVIVVLARQGSPGKMSEERSVPDRRADDQGEPGAPTTRQRSGDQWSDVMERPAGPDAESMSPDPPGDPPRRHCRATTRSGGDRQPRCGHPARLGLRRLGRLQRVPGLQSQLLADPAVHKCMDGGQGHHPVRPGRLGCAGRPVREPAVAAAVHDPRLACARGLCRLSDRHPLCLGGANP
jgi:hypothetical protein